MWFLEAHLLIFNNIIDDSVECNFVGKFSKFLINKDFFFL